jgi:hypothetical protein
MKKLLIFLAVLAFCLPTYAAEPNAVLVYKVKSTLKGVDLDSNDVNDVRVKVKFKAYLVMEVDYSAAVPVIDDDVVIVYGDDANGGYNEVNLPGTIDDFEQSLIKSKTGWGINTNATVGSAWEAIVTGKAKATDIGYGKEAKEVVAKSMKGHIIAYGTLTHYGNEVNGSGTVKLRLVKSLTKAANAANMTVAAVKTEIENDLPKRPTID